MLPVAGEFFAERSFSRNPDVFAGLINITSLSVNMYFTNSVLKPICPFIKL